MLLASLALVAVLLAGGLLALATRSLLSARVELAAATRRERRYRAWSDERARFLAARTSIAEAAQDATDAVQLGSSGVQAGHRAIAAIPFGILGSIPAASELSNRVRDVHDGIADAVYDTIATVSEGFGEASRRRLVGDPVTLEPEADADGSGPPARPTPPADHPG